MKMLMIGPRYHKSGEIGGIVVSFELMLREIQNKNIIFKVIDTNKSNYIARIYAIVIILVKAIILLPRFDVVVFNGTANDYKYIAPFIVFFSRLFHKKIILRKFAGSFIEEYKGSGSIIRLMIDYALRYSNVNFFQTRYLVKYFAKYNKNTFWLPTMREKIYTKRKPRTFDKKFIYLGQIRKEKGINELIEVSKMLDDSYSIDIYGPIFEDFQDKIEDSNMNYCGILDSKNVVKTLALYDVLVLPSYREGYPGVIIEALSVGLPVIATNLAGIQEMLTDECSKLIEVQNVDQLKDSIEFFNKDNYEKFSKNALDRFEIFDSEIVTERFLEVINAKS